jgi:hypothetical protein
LVTNEPIQTKEPKPLPIRNANFELVEFELVNNYLTHGSVIETYVPVEFNYVPNCNDKNNSFNEKLIDIYTLKVYNLKS